MEDYPYADQISDYYKKIQTKQGIRIEISTLDMFEKIVKRMNDLEKRNADLERDNAELKKNLRILLKDSI